MIALLDRLQARWDRFRLRRILRQLQRLGLIDDWRAARPQPTRLGRELLEAIDAGAPSGRPRPGGAANGSTP